MPVLLPDSSAQAALQAQDEARQPKAQNADLKRPVRIVVTQPRRIAAITVAKRVAEELGEKVRGFFFGCGGWWGSCWAILSLVAKDGCKL